MTDTATAQPPAEITTDIASTDAPLFTPGEVYTYIPWRMLTREALEACLIAKNLRDNKKNNPNAQGSSIWLKFNLAKFKAMYPNFHCKLNDDRPCIRTPFMHAPFGISNFPGKDGETISLSYGRARDDDVEAFAEWANNVFDAWVRDQIVANSKAWLGQTQNLDLIKAVYAGLYRFTEEDESKGYTAKTGGFKLLPKSKQPNLKAFHGDDSLVINRDNIPANCYLQLDTELSTFWFVKPRCGVSGNVARIDMRTAEEMTNPGYAVNKAQSPDPDPEDPIVAKPADKEDTQE